MQRQIDIKNSIKVINEAKCRSIQFEKFEFYLSFFVCFVCFVVSFFSRPEVVRPSHLPHLISLVQ